MYWSDFLYVIPEIALLIFSCALLLLGLFCNRKVINVIAIFSVLITIALLLEDGLPINFSGIFGGLIHSNFYIYFSKIFVLLLGLVILTMFMLSKCDYRYEFSIVILFSLFGMLTLLSANDLMSFYLSFEIQSIAIYVLAAFNRDSYNSSEAGIKYFVLGALSSCILLYGMSMVYGYTGSTNFLDISRQLPIKTNPGLILGLVFILVSLCFKLSVAPFHMWAPDVYQGSPTIVTTFFSVVPKATFILFAISLLNTVFQPLIKDWQQVLLGAALLSIFVSALGAMRQSNLKRLLAYGGIGHVGYMLMVMALGTSEGASFVLMYLFLYITMIIGVFAFLIRFEDEHCTLSNLNNLHKRDPFSAFNISILMMSMAGIPPIAGFFGKFYLLKSLIDSGFIKIAIVFVIASAIACFYYLKVIKVMYFDKRMHSEVVTPYNSFGLSAICFIMTLINLTFVFYLEAFQTVFLHIVAPLF